MIACYAPAAARAQDTHGSFVVTAVSATAGAAVGLGVAAIAYHGGSGACPAVPGSKCGDIGSAALAGIGGLLIGATTGAMIGGRVSGGHPSLVRSLAGAGLGLLVGGALVSAEGHNASTPALVVSLVVPMGVFAAFIGR